MTRRSWPGEVFDRLYAADPDPWRYETSDYERAKYAATLAALPTGPIGDALELACSIGVMTRQLAPRCRSLLSVDGAASALERAATRCAELRNVSFRHARLPEELPAAPPGGWSLAVISELLYFLSPDDIDRLADGVAAGCAPEASILLVNWLGETDTPCTGEEAATFFLARAREHGFHCTMTTRGGTGASDGRPSEGYRLDRLDRHPSG
ncbi:class I SAM-dependent DNA methyltransferase [Rhizosaccharibacter radicis]|uniref:Nodulation S family protein n=1 Tax=Rhizosaccharibacter radicis TaxID=2782605 RepID=A0ABT1VWI2_9PROT|nr:nodulation S family protein [Acetobacteraceae bacterium KSS12]